MCAAGEDSQTHLPTAQQQANMGSRLAMWEERITPAFLSTAGQVKQETQPNHQHFNTKFYISS